MHLSSSQHDYEASLIKRICNGAAKGENGFLFIQSPDLETVHRRLDPVISEEIEGFQFFGCSGKDLTSQPYFPFLDWAAAGLDSEIIDSLQPPVYSLHRQVFQSYLETGIAERHDEVLSFEAAFERQQIEQTMLGLLSAMVNNTPSCIFLRNAQLLPYSTVSLLRLLMDHAPDGIVVICSFTPVCVDTTDPAYENWQDLVYEAEKQGLLLNYHTPSQLEHKAAYKTGIQSIKLNLLSAQNAFVLQAYADCIRTLQKITTHVENRPSTVSLQDRVTTAKLYGMASYYMGEYETAITSLHHYLSLAQKQGDESSISTAYRWIAMVYLAKDNIQAAQSMADQALSIAEGIDDQTAVFYAGFIGYLTEGKIRTMPAPQFRTLFYHLIQLSHKLKLQNIEAFISINPYNLYGDYTEREQKTHEHGMRIARRLGNTFLLAAAYQLQGLAYSIQGEYRRVITSYKKSLKLKRNLNSNLEMSYIHNGLGFYYFMTGEHSKAQQSFSDALAHLRNEKDYHEIAMTLFNMGENALMCGEYDFAQQCLEQCLELMHSIERDNLAFHSRHCILSLFGFACVKAGKTARAWQVLITIEAQNLQPFENKNEESCYFAVLQALLAASSEEYQQAVAYLQIALQLIDDSKEYIGHLRPRILFELAEQKNNSGLAQEADRLLSECLHISVDQGNAFYIYTARHALHEKDWHLTGFSSRTKPASIDWLSGLARTQRHLRSLQRRIDEIHFINLLQSVRHRTIDAKDFIHSCLDILHSSLGVHSVMYFSAQQNIQFQYRRGPIAWKEDSEQRFRQLLTFVEHEKLFLPNSNPDIPHELQPFWLYITPILLREHQHNRLLGYLLISGDQHSINVAQEQRRIYSIATSIIEDSLLAIHQRDTILNQNYELKEKNKQLTKLSQTDFLTGLYNRSILYTSINQELHRIARYGQSAGRALLVLFIDLDNFKYFNDVYGHAVGDTMIKQAAVLLTESCRETDSAYRFGGDEFIVLLPQTTVEGGVRLARRIIKYIEQPGTFSSIIKEHTGIVPQIPADKKLSCSIGISSSSMVSFQTGNFEISDTATDELIQMADEAVYTAKKLGKGTAIVYKPKR